VFQNIYLRAKMKIRGVEKKKWGWEEKNFLDILLEK
jgi:hypothetical protein